METALWTLALVFAFLWGAAFESGWRRLATKRRWKSAPRLKGRPTRIGPDFDAPAQLRAVERTVFTARPLLNRGEARLFALVERVCREEGVGWRVMAQVCLGEILTSADKDAFRAINSKRVDLLLVGADQRPLHALELQGSGHHLRPAATRDAIKKEALRRAGIGTHEVTVGDTPAEVRALIAKLAARERAAA